jgi:hypothetical protein
LAQHWLQVHSGGGTGGVPMATPLGSFPTGIGVPTAVLLAVSITETLPERKFVT